jgi:hypothetical protein
MDPKLDATRLEASVISKNNWAKFGVFPNKNNVGNENLLPGRRCPGNPSFPQIGKANLSGYLPKKEMAVFFLTLNSGLAPKNDNSVRVGLGLGLGLGQG